MASCKRTKPASLHTQEHFAAIPEPLRLPALDTNRKAIRHMRLADDLLVRRCWEKANAAMSKLPPNRLIARHETYDGMMLTQLEAMVPYALSTSDRDTLNDYLFPDGEMHYTDELLRTIDA